MLRFNSTKFLYYINNKEKLKEISIPLWFESKSQNTDSINFFFLSNILITAPKSLVSFDLLSFVKTNFHYYNHFDDFKLLTPNQIKVFSPKNRQLSEFSYLKKPSFIKFFISNMIDVPICFKKSGSLKTKNFELPLLRFTNLLMKKGKKEKSMSIIVNSFRLFFKSSNLGKIKTSFDSLPWFHLYYITNNFVINNRQNTFLNQKLVNEFNSPLSFENIFNLPSTKVIRSSFFLKNYFFFLLSKVSPVFSYFIYNVDKNIRKYSRGKSGKYAFVWKYIAPFRRFNLAMRWITKDVKFSFEKNFSDRLLTVFSNLVLSPTKSFAWRSKTFSHNYIFKNFRKSLMTSLKTTS